MKAGDSFTIEPTRGALDAFSLFDHEAVGDRGGVAGGGIGGERATPARREISAATVTSGYRSRRPA